MHENEAAEVLYRMSACGTNCNEAETQKVIVRPHNPVIWTIL